MNKTELRAAFKSGLAKVTEKEFDKILPVLEELNKILDKYDSDQENISHDRRYHLSEKTKYVSLLVDDILDKYYVKSGPYSKEDKKRINDCYLKIDLYVKTNEFQRFLMMLGLR